MVLVLGWERPLFSEYPASVGRGTQRGSESVGRDNRAVCICVCGERGIFRCFGDLYYLLARLPNCFYKIYCFYIFFFSSMVWRWYLLVRESVCACLPACLPSCLPVSLSVCLCECMLVLKLLLTLSLNGPGCVDEWTGWCRQEIFSQFIS